MNDTQDITSSCSKLGTLDNVNQHFPNDNHGPYEATSGANTA